MAVTPRQRELLNFLEDFLRDNSFSPSYEEIAGALNLASLATVHKHIQAVEKKGYLHRSFNQSRSLELTSKYFAEKSLYSAKPRAVEIRDTVPLVGRIAAGTPVEAIAGEAALEFSDFTGGDSDTFALEVRGDSMIDDHICSGDYVLIKKSKEVRDGDIVVALVGGSDATLKRWYRESDGRIRLQPANSNMEPIYISPEDLTIQGKLLAVMRKYR